MTKGQIIIASFQSLTATSAGGIGQLGYLLAEKLHKSKLLKEFIVSSKGKFKTSFPSSPVHAISKYYLFLINKISASLNIAPYRSRYVQEYLYDWYCSMHLEKEVRAFVVTTPYLYRSLAKARGLGIKTYFIPGNPEDNYIAKLVHDENKKYGIEKDDAYTYRKRLDFYNRSLPLIDRIIVHSGIIEETYIQAGYGDKLIKVQGYLKPEFSSPDQRNQSPSGRFKVVFLSYTVLLKGLQYLLEAWKDVQDREIELHIGGIIDSNVQDIIDKQYKELKNVHYHGAIHDVAAFLSDKSLLVQPSLIDGGPVTVLEAMNSGVPVIVTENCGAKDMVEEGKTGWIIPIRNSSILRDKILEASDNREKSREMGNLGRKVISDYNMTGFVDAIGEVITKELSDKE